MKFKRLIFIIQFVAFFSHLDFAWSVEIKALFSPKGGSEAAIIRCIEGAKNRIDVAMFAFTSRRLAEALVKARDRGINVRILLDGEFNKNKFSKGNYLQKRDMDVLIDKFHLKGEDEGEKGYGIHGKMHNKFAIVDDDIVVTGSYNWTASAESRNDENLLIIKEAKNLASVYRDEFEKLWRRAHMAKKTKATKYTEDEEMEVTYPLRAGDIIKLKQYTDKEVVVRGIVKEVFHSVKSDTYFLNFGPRGNSLSCVIFKDPAQRFFEKGLNPFSFEGKDVLVRGILHEHKEYGLQIIIEEVSQIHIYKHNH